jgi:hypothetical protein
MFDKEIRGAIRSAKVKVKEDGAFVFRTVRMALELEFNSDAANTIGGAAADALDHLIDGGMTKIVLPIDAISARGVLEGKTRIALDRITGVKATASVGKAKEDEAAPLKLKLEFDFPFDAAAWAMLGAEAGSFIGVTLTRNQLDLPGTAKLPATPLPPPPPLQPAKDSGKKRKAGGARSTAITNVRLDPQDADTPEEAEAVREQRLREERAEDEGAWTTPGTH